MFNVSTNSPPMLPFDAAKFESETPSRISRSSSRLDFMRTTQKSFNGFISKGGGGGGYYSGSSIHAIDGGSGGGCGANNGGKSNKGDSNQDNYSKSLNCDD